MNDRVQEQVSALVDDELPAAETTLLVERLSRDAELRARLGRYQLISDVLNNRVGAPVSEGLADRVMRALDDEPSHQSTLAAAGAWRKLLKPVAGVAVAASVALVALLSVQSITQQSAPAPQLASSAPVQPEQQDFVRVQQGQWHRQAPQVRKRLNGYLVHHNEYATSSGVQGVLPYVRIVGNDSGNE